MSSFRFELDATDEVTGARAGRFNTPHGGFETPVFMPVGTKGAMRGLSVSQLAETGAEIILGNTYHLMQRPGEDVVRDLGGLHTFMGWRGPMLTDSGGFQVWSLAELAKRTENGVDFVSEIDGNRISLTPERVVEIQAALGADIIMPLDDCAEYPATRDRVAEAVQTTLRWTKRCVDAHQREYQALFPIVQGGMFTDLRVECAQALLEHDSPGYAVGGFSVGEPSETTFPLLRATNAELPVDRPRYVMGIGAPEHFLDAVAAGSDMMDCVLPTRNARHTMALTKRGPVRMRNKRHERDPRPLDESCRCYACRHHSRGYIRHLFMVKETLGPTLVSMHNLTFMVDLMRETRVAIREGRFATFRAEFKARLQVGDIEPL